MMWEGKEDVRWQCDDGSGMSIIEINGNVSICEIVQLSLTWVVMMWEGRYKMAYSVEETDDG